MSSLFLASNLGQIVNKPGNEQKMILFQAGQP
jgi:hypothetical protein